MRKDAYNHDDNDGADEDGAELAQVSSRLQEIDPTFVPKPDPTPSQPATAEIPRVRPLTKISKLYMGSKGFDVWKLFHPNLVGIDQAGLDKMAGISIRRLPTKNETLEDRLTS